MKGRRRNEHGKDASLPALAIHADGCRRLHFLSSNHAVSLAAVVSTYAGTACRGNDVYAVSLRDLACKQPCTPTWLGGL